MAFEWFAVSVTAAKWEVLGKSTRRNRTQTTENSS